MYGSYQGTFECHQIFGPFKKKDANTPNKNGWTPIHSAALCGKVDVIKYLAQFTENPNAQTVQGYTPIFWAASRGHLDVIKVLAPLCKNPNTAPTFEKCTPIQVAERNGHDEIKRILQSYIDAP